MLHGTFKTILLDRRQKHFSEALLIEGGGGGTGHWGTEINLTEQPALKHSWKQEEFAPHALHETDLSDRRTK